MPFRNMYPRAADEGMHMITPRGTIDQTNSNILDKAFGGNTVDMEEWNDWMRWEGTNPVEIETIQNIPPIPKFDRKHSNTNSTISNASTSNWFSEVDSASSDGAINGAYFPSPDFAFEDGAYEIEPTVPVLPYRYSTLTASEERTLQAIAMPPLAPQTTVSPSPTPSSNQSQSTSPEPEPEVRTRKTKKRKTASLDEPAARKRGHNAIEKRYRTNLNQKINELRAGVPPFCPNLNEDEMDQDSDAENGDSKTGQQKYGKAAILTRALEYIRHLENTTQRLGNDVVVLKTRVGAFEKLAMGGSLPRNGVVAYSEPTVIKKETLEDIRDVFKQIKPQCKITAAERKKSKSK